MYANNLTSYFRLNSCCAVQMLRIDFHHAPIQTMATSVSFPLNGHVGINALEKVTFATCSIQRKLLTKDVIGEWKDAVKNVLTDIHHAKVSDLSFTFT